jgi:hypothetical protein
MNILADFSPVWEWQAKHVTFQRQEKWSSSGEIYFRKSIDGKTSDILPVFNKKSRRKAGLGALRGGSRVARN